MTLTLAEQLDHVQRTNEETRIFVAEQHAVIAERAKLAAKRDKLDRARAPWMMVVAVLGSFAAGMVFVRLWGGL